MNIAGMKLLVEKNLPVFESFLMFNNFSEIPKEFLEKYNDKKVWAIYGSDNRTKLTDNPYSVKKFRFFNISNDELKEKFLDLNKQMEEEEIPSENRVFSIWKTFWDDDTFLTGIAWKNEDFILIDVFNGRRPSGKDWSPHFSFKVPIINGRCYFGNLDSFEFESLLRKICLDLMIFNLDGAYIDFAVMNDKSLFYHDLSFH